LAGEGQRGGAVSALQRWAIPDSTVGFYTGITLLGPALSSLIHGFLADRWGQKFNLMISAGAMGLSFALAWLAPAPSWYFAVFLCQGIGLGSAFTAGIMIVLEFCEPERRPTYIGIANTIAGLGGVVAPLLGTFLARADYGLLFAMSAALSLLALVLLRWWVVEPRRAGVAARSRRRLPRSPQLDCCAAPLFWPTGVL